MSPRGSRQLLAAPRLRVHDARLAVPHPASQRERAAAKQRDAAEQVAQLKASLASAQHGAVQVRGTPRSPARSCGAGPPFRSKSQRLSEPCPPCPSARRQADSERVNLTDQLQKANALRDQLQAQLSAATAAGAAASSERSTAQRSAQQAEAEAAALRAEVAATKQQVAAALKERDAAFAVRAAPPPQALAIATPVTPSSFAHSLTHTARPPGVDPQAAREAAAIAETAVHARATATSVSSRSQQAEQDMQVCAAPLIERAPCALGGQVCCRC